jgi:hypothetical protein
VRVRSKIATGLFHSVRARELTSTINPHWLMSD